MEELKKVIINLIDERVKALHKEPEYLTPKEAAKLLKVSAPTLISMMKSGRIDAIKLGGRVFVDKEKLNKSLQNHELFRYQHVKKG